MGVLRKGAAAAVAASLVFFGAAAFAADNIVPASNADLDAIVAAAKRAASAAGSCGSGECVKYSCSAATSAANALDDARVNLYEMQRALQQAQADYLKHLDSLMKEWANNNQRNAEVKHALQMSKMYSDIGKAMVDFASIVDSFQTIKDLAERLGQSGKLDPVEAANLNRRLADAVFEQQSGFIGTINDVTNFTTGEDMLPDVVSKLQTAKGAVSDVYGAYNDVREAVAKVAAIKDATQKAKVLAGLRGSAKSLGQLATKAGQLYAESLQKAMAEEVAENEKVMAGLDKAYGDVTGMYNALLKRQMAVNHALDAVRDSYQRGYACAAKCPNALGPRPVPDNAGKSYGEVMKAASGKMASLTKAIGASSSKLKVSKAEPSAQRTSASTLEGDQMTQCEPKPNASPAPASASAPEKCAEGKGMTGSIEALAGNMQSGCR